MIRRKAAERWQTVSSGILDNVRAALGVEGIRNMDGTQWAVSVAPAGASARVYFYDDLAAAERMYEHQLAEHPCAYVDILEMRADGKSRWVRRNDEVTA